MRKYDVRSIMASAWRFFRSGKFGSFSDSLRTAWGNAKMIVKAKKEAGVEVAHTWYGWKTRGFEVIHESVAIFKVTVADAKTKNGTRVLSYFAENQVAAIA